MKLKTYTLLALVGVMLLLLCAMVSFVHNITGATWNATTILVNNAVHLVAYSLIALFFYKLYKNQN